MGKLLEVREFDSIICNENYKENEKYKYMPTMKKILHVL